MLVVREIMHCKPGKVRPMVEKFLAMSKIMQRSGVGKMRVLTDLSAERYWTVVAEIEMADLGAFEKMMSGMGQNKSDDDKEMEKIMKDYHDLIVDGRREIYKVEG